ncbi:DNA repair protein REV1-like [Ciona intestinalis]
MGGRGIFKVMSDDGWSSMGGYMEAKIQKLEKQFQEKSSRNEQLSSIFNKVAIHVNGYTNPTADELKTLMAKHGGKYHAYYNSNYTTHVITSNLPRAKAKDLKPNQKIVRPEWIVESIKAGNLLPIQPYLLVANSSVSRQKILTSKKEDKVNPSSNPSTSKYIEDITPQIKPEEGVDTPQCGTVVANHVNQQASSRTSKIAATTDSGFLDEFYANSRLHFISTWKNDLADFVRALSQNNQPFTGKEELLKLRKEQNGNLLLNGKVIMHIDMDCFFVSVGLLSRPYLKGLPVAVTHHSSSTPSEHKQRPGTDPNFERSYYKEKLGKNFEQKFTSNPVGPSDGKASGSASKANTVPSYSEIASCSYEARAAGLRNGMFYGRAKELCPDLIAIPYDFKAYKEISQKLYTVLASYTQSLEAVSCDEALLDVTQLVKDTNLTPQVIAQNIRGKILDATGCDASAGIGPNIALARMATRLGKPNGQHEVTLEQAEEFIRDLPVKDLPGVGRSTASRLRELGANTCKELQKIHPDLLKKEFGNKTGQKLHELSKGIDEREVCQSKERKSVSADVNYGIRLKTEDEMKTFLNNLSNEVSSRLKKTGLSGKKITLKLMVRHSDAPVETAKFKGHGVCNSISRSKNLNEYIDDCDIIGREAIALIKSLQSNVTDLRGIGIQLSTLSSTSSLSKSRLSIQQFMKKGKRKSSEMQINTPEQKNDPAVYGNQETEPTVKTDCQNKVAKTEPAFDLREEKCETNDSAKNDSINTSFLDALPEELRKEIEKDYKAQKNALQQVKKPEPSSASNSPTKTLLQQSTLRGQSSKRGHPTGSKSRRKVSRKVVKKSPVKKLLPLKAVTSPNKLITDMFSKIPKKEVGKIEPVAKRSLEDAVTICEEKIDDVKNERKINKPSLGGATTTAEVRDVIRKWTRAYSQELPLDSDIEDIINYLCTLVNHVRDLESTELILRTIRRYIGFVIERNNNVEMQTVWLVAYSRILCAVNKEVESLYDGAQFHLPSLHLP